MKFKLLSFAMLISSYVAFAGNTASTNQTKMKIASKETLKKRAEKTTCNEEFLDSVKFVAIFADKEMSLADLNSGFSTLEANLWADVKAKVQQEMGTVAYYGLLPLMTKDLNKQLKEIKPTLIKILLEEDFPELCTQALE